jgi:hypothetical protein
MPYYLISLCPQIIRLFLCFYTFLSSSSLIFAPIFFFFLCENYCNTVFLFPPLFSFLCLISLFLSSSLLLLDILLCKCLQYLCDTFPPVCLPLGLPVLMLFFPPIGLLKLFFSLPPLCLSKHVLCFPCLSVCLSMFTMFPFVEVESCSLIGNTGYLLDLTGEHCSCIRRSRLMLSQHYTHPSRPFRGVYILENTPPPPPPSGMKGNICRCHWGQKYVKGKRK